MRIRQTAATPAFSFFWKCCPEKLSARFPQAVLGRRATRTQRVRLRRQQRRTKNKRENPDGEAHDVSRDFADEHLGGCSGSRQGGRGNFGSTYQRGYGATKLAHESPTYDAQRYTPPNVAHFGRNATDKVSKTVVVRIKAKEKPITT
jgi:hypothetical protein